MSRSKERQERRKEQFEKGVQEAERDRHAVMPRVDNKGMPHYPKPAYPEYKYPYKYPRRKK